MRVCMAKTNGLVVVIHQMLILKDVFPSNESISSADLLQQTECSCAHCSIVELNEYAKVVFRIVIDIEFDSLCKHSYHLRKVDGNDVGAA